jgi:hypothetical protein
MEKPILVPNIVLEIVGRVAYFGLGFLCGMYFVMQ